MKSATLARTLASVLSFIFIMHASLAAQNYNPDIRDNHTWGTDRDGNGIAWGTDRDERSAPTPPANPRARKVPRPKGQTRVYYTNGDDGAFKYAKLILRKAAKYKIDYFLMLAIVQAESSGNPAAVSPADCHGLTQLHIHTARSYSPNLSRRDLYNPVVNIEIAARHMARLQNLVDRQFPGINYEERVELLASAWNAGWGQTKRSGGVPNIHETKKYVRRVLNFYRQYLTGAVS